MGVHAAQGLRMSLHKGQEWVEGSGFKVRR